MRKHACHVCLLLLATALLILACKKQDAPSSPDPVLQQAISKVNTWLDDQRAAGNEDKNIRIQQIKDKLDYAHLHFEDFDEGERFIIIPVKSGLATINNPGKQPINVLLLIENKAGVIRRGNIVQYIPDQALADAAIPVNSFSKIFNAEKPDKDAQFCFLTLTDRLLYQVKYKDGILQSDGVTRPGGSTIVNSPPQAPIGPEPVCTDWYLLTTYYYADGSTDQTEEYLYTTCESGGGGGGSGEGNDMEYEFAASREKNWTVYAPSGWFPSWEVNALVQLKGKRNSSEPQGGHFTAIDPKSVDCIHCSSQGVGWETTYNEGTVSGQSALHQVIGRLYLPGNPTYQSINKTGTFLFKNVF